MANDKEAHGWVFDSQSRADRRRVSTRLSGDVQRSALTFGDSSPPYQRRGVG